MAFKFVVKNLEGEFDPIKDYPFFVLIQKDWDDFGFVTEYVLSYHKSRRVRHQIGSTKILQLDNKQTRLPMVFSKLSPKVCSLGQSNSFYENLKELFTRQDCFLILSALNDITYNKGLFQDFERAEGFNKSLMRYSEAQKAFNEAERIILDIKTKNCFKFSFTTHIEGFIEPHIVKFGFKAKSPIPKRITAFIGKNGSGKTQVLSRLASSLSGSLQRGTFSTEYLPPFSRVIAISYNLFDKFEKPKKTKSFSYYYCGIQTESKLLTDRQIHKKINDALKIIYKNRHNVILGQYLTELLGEDVAIRVLGEDFGNENVNFSVHDKAGNTILSSGQIILVLVLTEILAYIRKESLLLFDEPETHLHPNAISKMVAIICKILHKFDSYAIIATHSPQIIQEIPSSEIFLFSNTPNIPSVRKLSMETFGENLTTLTEQIFQTVNVDEFYKKVLTDLSEEYSSKEILTLFKKDGAGLSLNARIYLESLKQKS